jgi:hypothetical protein
MAEDFDPFQEGRRVARNYLSKLGWARQWRRALNTQLYPGFLREEFEEKERRCDQFEEEAEAYFSSEYEKWRKEDSPGGREVRRGMFELLGRRTDLGFFGKRIVDRLKREFSPR